MAETVAKPVNWRNALTVMGATILVGTETIGAGVATGWALGGIFRLGEIGQGIAMAAFGSLGIVAMVAFLKLAMKVEPFR